MTTLTRGFCVLACLATLEPQIGHSDDVPSLKEVAPRAVHMRQKKLDEINPALDDAVSQGKISGAVTLVAKDGKLVWLRAVGYANVAKRLPMQNDSLFAIASMTKPVTATAVMILRDEGKLGLDDPVSKYIPEFSQAALENEKLRRQLTIRDLLTHTSGLVGSQRNTGSLAETAVDIARRPLGFQPGDRWQYSPGITVCGRVIEVASGMPYHQFLQERIFDPLEMKDTTFFPNLFQRERIVSLYKPGKQPGTIEETDHWLSNLGESRTANPSGGLFSTAYDMAKFYQMILNDGKWGETQVVSSESVREMTKVQTGELSTGFTPGNGWGLGWCVVREPQGVTAALSSGSFGHGGAFGTQGWVDPQDETIFILMIQRTGFGNSDGSALRKEFQDVAEQAIIRPPKR